MSSTGVLPSPDCTPSRASGQAGLGRENQLFHVRLDCKSIDGQGHAKFEAFVHVRHAAVARPLGDDREHTLGVIGEL